MGRELPVSRAVKGTRRRSGAKFAVKRGIGGLQRRRGRRGGAHRGSLLPSGHRGSGRGAIAAAWLLRAPGSVWHSGRLASRQRTSPSGAHFAYETDPKRLGGREQPYVLPSAPLGSGESRWAGAAGGRQLVRGWLPHCRHETGSTTVISKLNVLLPVVLKLFAF